MIPELEKCLSSPYSLFSSYEQDTPHRWIQHQPLLHLLEELFEGFYDGNGHELIGKSLHRLREYADTTLAEVEELLLLCGYSGLSQVRTSHNLLIDQTQKWSDEYRSGANILSFELYQFLRQWYHDYLDSHGHLIQGHDQAELRSL